MLNSCVNSKNQEGVDLVWTGAQESEFYRELQGVLTKEIWGVHQSCGSRCPQRLAALQENPLNGRSHGHGGL